MKMQNPKAKLAAALLDDPNGISREAFEVLKEVLALSWYKPAEPVQPHPDIEKILAAVDSCEGRVYLPENWDKQESSTKTA